MTFSAGHPCIWFSHDGIVITFQVFWVPAFTTTTTIIIICPPSLSLFVPCKMFDWISVPVYSVSITLIGMVTLQSIRELPRQQTYKNTAVITWRQCSYCHNLCCYTSFYWGNFKHTWVSCTYEHFFFKLLFWFHHIIHAQFFIWVLSK
jgi:hypothetical protein